MKKLLYIPVFVLFAAGLLAKPVPPPQPEAKKAPRPALVPNELAKRLELLLGKNLKGGAVPPAELKKLIEMQLQVQDQLLRKRIPLGRPQIQPIPGFIVPPNGRPMPMPMTTIPARNFRPKVEAVELLDGSKLQGKFIGFDPTKGLIWRHPHIKPDQHIDPTQIAHVTFAPKKDAGHKAQGTRVTLANGDELSGELARMDEKQLVLKTWYGGELKLNRNAIRTLIPGQVTASVIYEGPDKDDGWVFSNSQAMAFKNRILPQGRALPPAVIERQKQQAAAAANIKWVYQDGAFQSNGSNAQVGRDFKMANRVNLEFDVEWTSSMSLYVSLFTDNLKQYSQANTYSLRLTQSSAYLYRYEFGKANNFRRSARIGQTQRYSLTAQPGKRPIARVSVRMDKAKKEIALVINGMKVAQWRDPAANFVGKGNGVMFRASTSIPMRLANIRVSEWDGNLPGKVNITGGNPNEDFVQLVNEDTLNGKLISIGNGKVNFSTSFSPKLPIPLGRVSAIKLAANTKTPANDERAVRITLRNRGQITASLKSWKEGKVTLTSPALGEATLDINAIVAMEFNLGKTKVAANGAAPGIGSSTTVNINGVQVPQQMLNGGFGRLNIPGAQLEIIPGGGLRIERKFKIEPRIPRIQPRRR